MGTGRDLLWVVSWWFNHHLVQYSRQQSIGGDPYPPPPFIKLGGDGGDGNVRPRTLSRRIIMAAPAIYYLPCSFALKILRGSSIGRSNFWKRFKFLEEHSHPNPATHPNIHAMEHVCLHSIFGQITLSEKECHVSLRKLTKIDRAKNHESCTSFVYKNATKILPAGWQNFRVGKWAGCFNGQVQLAPNIRTCWQLIFAHFVAPYLCMLGFICMPWLLHAYSYAYACGTVW